MSQRTVTELRLRAVRIGWWLTAALLIGYVALIAVPGAAAANVRDHALYGLVFVASAATAFLRARAACAVGEEWRAWLYVGSALLLVALAWYCTCVLDGSTDAALALVEGALAYPLLYAALARMLRRRMLWWHTPMVFDGIIAALAGGAVVAAFVNARSGAAHSMFDTWDFLFPVADMLLVGLAILGVQLVGHRPDAQWGRVLVAVVLLPVGDAAYLTAAASTSRVATSLPDVLYLLAPLALAWSAVAPDPPSPVEARHRGAAPALLTSPIVSSVVAIAMLVPQSLWSPPPVSRWLASLALAVAAVRSVSVYRELLQLAIVRREASTDELTGLVNRRAFRRAGAALLAQAGDAEPAQPVALLVMDLDGFKEVNDSLGHAEGDHLLTLVAARIVGALVHVPDVVVARLGGDEFAALAPMDLHTARSAAQRVVEAVVAGVRIEASMSIGVACVPAHAGDLDALLRSADEAMYRAKTDHSSVEVFDPTQTGPDGEGRLQHVAELRAGIENGELVVYYQPKIDLMTGAVVGVEALVRWQSAHGLVYPDDFLPLVTSSGLMPALTATVLDQALVQTARWHRSGHLLTVSVNLPASAVVDDGLPDRVLAMLATRRVPAAALQLEITEESLLADRIRARAVLARLRAAGVSIAIDDYGTGYSSLAYLRELPVDELKLDRSFVFPMEDDPRAASIVRSTVDLAHALGLTIVAEGVEHEQAALALAGFGCDTAQGYHFARPLPAEELTGWLESVVAIPRQREALKADLADRGVSLQR